MSVPREKKIAIEFSLLQFTSVLVEVEAAYKTAMNGMAHAAKLGDSGAVDTAWNHATALREAHNAMIEQVRNLGIDSPRFKLL